MAETKKKPESVRAHRFEQILGIETSKFQLKTSVSVRKFENGELLLRELGSSYRLKLDSKVWSTESLTKLLILLRRGASKSELLQTADASVLEKFLTDLFEFRLLLWPDPSVSPEDARVLSPEWEGLLKNILGPDQRLSAGRLRILGQENSQRMAEYLKIEIEDCPGLELLADGDTSPADLLVYLTDEEQLDRVSRWNQEAVGRGQAWMALIEDGYGGILTPIFGRNGDPCFECYRMRTEANLKPTGSDFFTEPDYFAERRPKAVPLFQRQIAGRLCIEALKFASGLSLSVLENGALFFDCFNQRSEFHDFMPMTSCPVCRGGFSPAPPAAYSFLMDAEG